MSGAVMEAFKHGVGAVDLVAGGAEVLADRAEIGAAGDAVLHQPRGLRLIGVGAGASVDAQLGFEPVADRAGIDGADQALVGWPGGIAPPGSHRTEREPLGSLRSSHRIPADARTQVQCANSLGSRSRSPDHHALNRL